MFFRIPGQIKEFCGLFSSLLSKPQLGNVSVFLTGICLGSGSRSMAQLGRTVVSETRYRGSVSRAFGSRRLRTRDLTKAVAKSLIESAVRRGTPERWFLSIDAVSTRRGGFTKIINARQYHKKSEGSRGAGSKAFTFLFGLLINERGERIPLPRKTWWSEAEAKKNGKRFRTQVDLACDLVSEAREYLPNSEIVVLADSAFANKKLSECCQREETTFIVPLSRNRCFTPTGKERKQKTKRRKIRERLGFFGLSSWDCFNLVSSKEESASYRRHSKRERELEKRRSYRVICETQDVSELGNVQVVYSQKSPVYTARGPKNEESLKVLACNDSSLTARQIAEYYEIRWQIELFFRELKSGLGLGEFRGQNFFAFERHVDLVVLAFMCLEWMRIEEKSVRNPSQARTTDMKQWLAAQALKNDFEHLEQLLQTESGTETVRGKIHAYLGSFASEASSA
ncbi:MAG: transposase [Planctomycetota bacterium]